MNWFPLLQGRFEELILVYFLLLNGIYLALFLVAYFDVRAFYKGSLYADLNEIFNSPLTPGISLLVPAFNEEADIVQTVESLLHLEYPRHEVIVINDGSTDRTMAILRREFDLLPSAGGRAAPLPTEAVLGVYRSRVHRHLTVIDKRKGGKSDALNAGLNAAKHPYFCSIDADDVLESDALLRIVGHVLESPRRVVAVGGVVRVLNGCRVEKGRIAKMGLGARAIEVFQVVEYCRAFLCGRMGFSHLNAVMILSGAFAMFETELVVSIGGYRRGTVGEDMELVTRLHRRMRDEGIRDYCILFVPDPVCWTRVPDSLPQLSLQRRRWHRGLLEVLGGSLGMLGRARYGAVGLLAFPFMLVFEGWGVVLECLGYLFFLFALIFGDFDGNFVLAFFAVAVLCGTALSMAGILLGEITHRRYPELRHLLRLFAYCLIENLFYRPLTAGMRLLGVWDYLVGGGEWGVMRSSAVQAKA